jgi:sulfur carrier protein
MKLILNGQPCDTESESLAALLDELGLSNRRIAVAVNDEIVDVGRRGEIQLHDGDRIEIFTYAGGG